jgi:pimeloyl-ACP methyl ester carboxylesterase
MPGITMMIPILMALDAFPAAGRAEQRSLPSGPRVETLRISFNDETIKGFVLLIDSRTNSEKDADIQRGHPAGPVVVFFQGHGQRPDSTYGFSSRLAIMCRSGIAVVPVCDTPYGRDPRLHGNSGKDVILMEMVRFILARQNIFIEDFSSVPGMRVSINGSLPVIKKNAAGTKVILIGWSHGGILARRIAHAYPASICSLGQVCPAGYERWGGWGITGRFASESLRIFVRMGNGHTGQMMSSAWGLTKGITGDFFRSLPGAVLELNLGKAGRIFKDIQDCSAYCDSSSFRAAHLDRIAAIFGADDTCMDPMKQLGIENLSQVTTEDRLRFHKTFFADVRGSEQVSLRILPGSHLAPAIHSELYAKTLLADLGELAHP